MLVEIIIGSVVVVAGASFWMNTKQQHRDNYVDHAKTIASEGVKLPVNAGVLAAKELESRTLDYHKEYARYRVAKSHRAQLVRSKTTLGSINMSMEAKIKEKNKANEAHLAELDAILAKMKK